MKHEKNLAEFSLKLASIKDRELIFNWRNETITRKYSLNKDLISKEVHNNWYSKVLNLENTRIFIFLNNQNPVGMIRFENKSNKIEINYLIDKDHRKKGYSVIMIKMGIHQIRLIWPKITFQATVLRDNKPSQKVLQNIGFSLFDEKDLKFFYIFN